MVTADMVGTSPFERVYWRAFEGQDRWYLRSPERGSSHVRPDSGNCSYSRENIVSQLNPDHFEFVSCL